ncbi:MAG: hypothetical protein ACLTFB_00920 [Candidatus Phytoplasma pyri]
MTVVLTRIIKNVLAFTVLILVGGSIGYYFNFYHVEQNFNLIDYLNFLLSIVLYELIRDKILNGFKQIC